MIAVLCVLAALLTAALWLLIRQGGDHTTPGTLLLFAPRRFVPVAWGVLAVFALVLSWRWAVFALAGAVLSALLVAGLNVPRVASRPPGTVERPVEAGLPLRVVTYNVDFDAGLGERLAEAVRRWDADVILLQACGDDAFGHLARATDAAVFLAKIHEFCFASRYPIVDSDHLGYPDQRGRPIAARIRVVVDRRLVSVVAVHFASPRRELTAALQLDFSLIPRSITTRDGQSALLLKYLRDNTDPVVVAGDFNTVAEGRVYREHFGAGFRNVFTERGTGYGYTMRNGLHRVRIDHVLVRTESVTGSISIEPDWPTEHHPVVAEVRVR